MRKVGLLVALALLSCSRSRDEGSPEMAAEGPVRTPFVLFSAESLVIDRLGAPVPVPVAVGSTPSPQTIASDAPDVVSVGPDGSLLGHRNGRATLTARGGLGSVLVVQVLAASTVAISPRELELRAFDHAQLRLFAEDGGEEIPGAAAQWFSDAPGVTLVKAGRVEAFAPGRAVVTAVYGGVSAKAMVHVKGGKGPTLAISPERPALRVGEIITFDVRSERGRAHAALKGSAPEILQQSGPATFVAKASGRAVVCASAGGREACTPVVVRR